MNKKYSVWVGGIEINDNLLTQDEANKLAEIYKQDGYEDVAISEDN